MKPVAIKLLCVGVLSLCICPAMAVEKGDAAVKKAPPVKAEVPAKKGPAGKGAITVKKNEGGSLELSNLNDDEDAELLVENQEKPKAEGPGVTASDRSEAVPRNDDPSDAAERAERRAQRDRPRSEDENLAGGQRGGQVGAAYSGAAYSGAAYSGAGNAGAGSSGASGSDSGYSADGNALPNTGGSAMPNIPNTATMPAASSENNAIMPNPRPGTEQAVPATVDTASSANQERYRNRMVQEATTGVVSRSQAVVENPAAVRRYIATDRATYQKALGY